MLLFKQAFLHSSADQTVTHPAAAVQDVQQWDLPVKWTSAPLSDVIALPMHGSQLNNDTLFSHKWL